MHDFLSTLILPLPILLLLILTGIAGYFLKKKRLARICGIGAIIWLGLITTGILPEFLVRSLEHKYPTLLIIEKPDTTVPVYIIVLGSGHTDDKSLPPNSQLERTLLGRLIEGIRLYHALPGSILIFSGDKGKQTESPAVILSQTAGFLGVSPDDIRMFTTTKNTADEAKTFRLTFGNQNKLYVVTDAIHMPRAMYLFTREGINTTAAPTNYLCKKGSHSSPLGFLIPQSDNISRMEAVIHEYAGLLWARLGDGGRLGD
ncbi:MAG: YdcF family protein [Bacteroidia bacterium]|nr:YdcF family protein [Bacteroidia bacterium]